MDVKYIKPLLDDMAIEKFEDVNNICFTEEFREFFKKNNGGRPVNNICILENGSEKVLNSFLSFNEVDKENVYKARKRVCGDDSELIPFANDPAGNYFCLKKGEVVFYSHEDGEVFSVAKSFGLFLRNVK